MADKASRGDEKPAVDQVPAVDREEEDRDALDARDRRPDITARPITRRINR